MCKRLDHMIHIDKNNAESRAQKGDPILQLTEWGFKRDESGKEYLKIGQVN